ncbi:MAG: DJ-1/PfpI family protein [Acidobacteriota bacterium]
MDTNTPLRGSAFSALLAALVLLLGPAPAWAGEGEPRGESQAVNFSAALAGLMFDPATADGNGGPGGAPNGLLDAAEMALVAAALEGGNPRAAAAWEQALGSATRDLEALAASFPTAPVAVAGYAMIGTPQSLESIGAMTANFGAPLEGDYSLASALGDLFGPEGDADGDGSTNRREYRAARAAAGRDFASGAWIADYAAAALDADRRPAPGEIAVDDAEKPARLTLGVVLYPGFEVLDVYGPLEMWGYVPEFRIVTVAERAGPVASSHGVETVAEHSFENSPDLDLLMVPGGAGTFVSLRSEPMLDYLRRAHASAQVTTSVCTGAMLLAAAGILDGRPATSNKLHFQKAREVSDRVRWIEKARWVDDGDVITSSGVSAGIDMALHLVARLYGRERAEQLAQWTEYTWNSDPSNDPFVSSIGAH